MQTRSPRRTARRAVPRGFTLMELLVYLALVVIVMVPVITIALTVVRDDAKRDRTAEVDAVGAFALERVARWGRHAQAVGSGTVYATNPGTLTFEDVSGELVTINTEARTIFRAGQSVPIRVLRAQVGSAAPVVLTSEAVDVTQFVVHDRTGSGAAGVALTLELTAVNPDGDPAFGATRQWTYANTTRR